MYKEYFLALFLLTTVSVVRAEHALNSSSPSLSNEDREDRIVGGAAANNGVDRGTLASIRFSTIQGNFHVGGGFIINKHWVGTAAKCLEGLTINTTVVAVGTLTIGGGIIHRVNQLVPHHNYNPYTLTNDIGLIRTTEEIIFTVNNAVRPGPISFQIANAGSTVTIYGWGVTSAGGALAPSLLRNSFSVLTLQNCLDNFPFVARRFITDRHICTRTTVAATCPGDAGGPIIFNGLVVGIVSWVEPCVVGQTNVNTRISSYFSWILSFTHADEDQ